MVGDEYDDGEDNGGDDGGDDGKLMVDMVRMMAEMVILDSSGHF